ncbi:MAG: DNA-deoxyinosine glycosylase [Clostridia bacterium]|nr:DNA-deoxyinosine glycosylase [Clostridia bacterium]
MNERIKDFKPIVFNDSKVLILGTLPGRKSLEEGFYYADKGNYFWKFFMEYTGCGKRPTNIAEAGDVVRLAKVALWDVFESGIREDKTGKRTSNDSDIAEPVPNKIPEFLQEHPGIERIGVTGSVGYNAFCRYFPDIKATQLPSSSGANAVCWGMETVDGIRRIRRDRKGWKTWKAFIEGDL